MTFEPSCQVILNLVTYLHNSHKNGNPGAVFLCNRDGENVITASNSLSAYPLSFDVASKRHYAFQLHRKCKLHSCIKVLKFLKCKYT